MGNRKKKKKISLFSFDVGNSESTKSSISRKHSNAVARIFNKHFFSLNSKHTKISGFLPSLSLKKDSKSPKAILKSGVDGANNDKELGKPGFELVSSVRSGGHAGADLSRDRSKRTRMTSLKLFDEDKPGSVAPVVRSAPTVAFVDVSFKSDSRPTSSGTGSSKIDSRKRSLVKELSSTVYILNYNRKILKKVNGLRYRENVFRAASRLTKEMPPYPDWVYENEDMEYQDLYRINVGGVIFVIFAETLKNLIHTKLACCIRNHTNKNTPFFDRDPRCFGAILNFYRTGRLHIPRGTCLKLYSQELEFWGISELFIEPCCWSAYSSFKTATSTIKKFAEDKMDSFENMSKSSLMRWRLNMHSIVTKGSGSVLANWMSTLCTMFICLSVFSLIISTISVGRRDRISGKLSKIKKNETVIKYLQRTRITGAVHFIDLLVSGFFLTEFCARLSLCPSRLEFFSDTLNWVDLMATVIPLFSSLYLRTSTGGSIEGYMLILKLPRMFRLFKLTPNLRIGMEAFILTIRASAKELKLVMLMLFIASSVFGVIIFVVEMVNEDEHRQSKVKNAYDGLWVALVTMSTVGYGEMHPITYMGYLVTSICILCGVIICQLPVPVFLQNFQLYHNQASARLYDRNKLLIHCENPETRMNKPIMKKKKKARSFVKMFRRK